MIFGGDHVYCDPRSKNVKKIIKAIPFDEVSDSEYEYDEGDSRPDYEYMKSCAENGEFKIRLKRHPGFKSKLLCINCLNAYLRIKEDRIREWRPWGSTED